jgi:hypothetical protein
VRNKFNQKPSFETPIEKPSTNPKALNLKSPLFQLDMLHKGIGGNCWAVNSLPDPLIQELENIEITLYEIDSHAASITTSTISDMRREA